MATGRDDLPVDTLTLFKLARTKVQADEILDSTFDVSVRKTWLNRNMLKLTGIF